jgi:23S rRNA (cytosine1962-C5)-methyltransferase
MQQLFGKYLMFYNRLLKVYRHLSKQAVRQGITCYRIYDHDLPEFPFIIEMYEGHLYVSEYKRRHELSEAAHQEWMEQCIQVMEEVTGIKAEAIFIKLRKRKEDRKDQYQKLETTRHEFVVHENGLQFIVNMTDYLDTGLFLDHRITRGMVKEMASGKKVLNLFCYTGSFSVYAAAGSASQVTSVDISKTYLDWARRNVELNFPDYDRHEVVHADVLTYLKTLPSDFYDIIILDPPTFSNSKRMDDILDIQRDHVTLIRDCLQVLKEGGVLFFSTNYTKFEFNYSTLASCTIKDITKATTPFDFTGKLNRPCFRITK